jgi:hypothetical protein
MKPSTRHKISVPNGAILELISEDEVHQWLAAKLAAIRALGLPAHSIEIEASYRKDYGESYYDVSCSTHGAGKFALTHESFARAVHDFAEELDGNPLQQAAEKRRAAERLKREADELVEMAKNRLGPIGPNP